jgi:DNA-binding transcriptional ArsR family regulator
MDAQDTTVAEIAAAIGEPARARILFCLLDGCARTSTELSVVANVSPSTASVHLARLKSASLVSVRSQGKHRYYSLRCEDVGRALEGLAVLAGGTRTGFVPSTPTRLRTARTCYDHLAGRVGVAIHDRISASGWLCARGNDGGYDLTPEGADGFATLGIDVQEARAKRRRFASACLDWSERRPHLGGALGAMFLSVCIERKWLARDLDSRALSLTTRGRNELERRFGLKLGEGTE